jgi:hypothetical protein
MDKTFQMRTVEAQMRTVEAEHGRLIETLLTEAWERHPSYQGVAAALGITHQTPKRWVFERGLKPHSTLRKDTASDDTRPPRRLGLNYGPSRPRAHRVAASA